VVIANAGEARSVILRLGQAEAGLAMSHIGVELIPLT
jgi:hypothetical protein